MIDKSSGSRQSLNRILDTVADLPWYLPQEFKVLAMGAPTPTVVLEGGQRCLPFESHRPAELQAMGALRRPMAR